MSEPIIEFRDEAQAYECLAEWQKRLFLDDWLIKLRLVDDDEIDDDNFGEVEYRLEINAAVIRLRHKNDKAHLPIEKQPILKMVQEKSLVHELLHLKFTITDTASNSWEGAFANSREHTLIEQMAKSLIMAKYNLPFEWFKNF